MDGLKSGMGTPLGHFGPISISEQSVSSSLALLFPKSLVLFSSTLFHSLHPSAKASTKQQQQLRWKHSAEVVFFQGNSSICAMSVADSFQGLGSAAGGMLAGGQPEPGLLSRHSPDIMGIILMISSSVRHSPPSAHSATSLRCITPFPLGFLMAAWLLPLCPEGKKEDKRQLPSSTTTTAASPRAQRAALPYLISAVGSAGTYWVPQSYQHLPPHSASLVSPAQEA